MLTIEDQTKRALDLLKGFGVNLKAEHVKYPPGTLGTKYLAFIDWGKGNIVEGEVSAIFKNEDYLEELVMDWQEFKDSEFHYDLRIFNLDSGHEIKWQFSEVEFFGL